MRRGATFYERRAVQGLYEAATEDFLSSSQRRSNIFASTQKYSVVRQFSSRVVGKHSNCLRFPKYRWIRTHASSTTPLRAACIRRVEWRRLSSSATAYCKIVIDPNRHTGVHGSDKLVFHGIDAQPLPTIFPGQKQLRREEGLKVEFTCCVETPRERIRNSQEFLICYFLAERPTRFQTPTLQRVWCKEARTFRSVIVDITPDP
jgi:hypothetical protein